MRTKNLLELKKEVSKINNYQAQIKFVYEQFLIDNRDKIKERDVLEFSSELFATNKYSNEFNVGVGKIEKSLNESKAFIFKSIFVFLYTRFEVFLRNSYNTAKIDFELEIQELSKFKIPDTFFKELEIQLDSELQITFEYLRLRRNSIVHRSEDKISQGEISTFINANGKRLNDFWKVQKNFGIVKGIVIRKMNFSNKDLGKFNEDEVIDVFNLYRLLAEVIDQKIIEKFDRKRWIDYILKKYKEGVTDNPKSFKDFDKQMKWFSVELLNIKLTDEELKKMYGGIV